MSETIARTPEGLEPYETWQQAAMGGNLLSYAWQHRPEMNQLVPGYRPDESTVQKLLDYGSLPARLAAAPLLQGGEAFRRWMSGDQGPEVRQEILGSLLGLAGGGLTRAAPGPASFGAWHGSRHLFEPEPGAPLGAFKPIEEVAGTGEGSQAFAFGHYAAGRRETSESYMQAGAENRVGVYKLDGKEVKPISFWDAADSTHPDFTSKMGQYWGMNFLAEHGGDHAAAINSMRGEARDLYKQAKELDPSLSDERRGYLQNAQEYLQGAKWLDNNKERLSYTPPDPGHLYQLAIRPDEHELLDWDRPLTEQHPQVQEALIHNGLLPESEVMHGVTGEQLYRDLAMEMGPAGASKALHEAGVPGVKFLDAGSRGLRTSPYKTIDGDTGQWAVRGNNVGEIHSVHDTQAEAEAAAEAARTRNYVIFHHHNLKVIDRDGKEFGVEPVKVEDPWSVVPRP